MIIDINYMVLAHFAPLHIEDGFSDLPIPLSLRSFTHGGGKGWRLQVPLVLIPAERLRAMEGPSLCHAENMSSVFLGMYMVEQPRWEPVTGLLAVAPLGAALGSLILTLKCV